MTVERRVKLFRNGRSQAVRIPVEFRLPATEVVMRKEGDRLTLEPVPKKDLRQLLMELKDLG